MKIAVTDITRMQLGYFCVAGVNIDTGQHVRPVQPMSRLRDTLCARRGGPFDMATVVDLGLTRPVPTPPEMEDHEFTPHHARTVQQIDATLYWEMLCHLAQSSLGELFGPALRKAGRDRALVDQGGGTASLGVLAPRGRPKLVAEKRDAGGSTLRLHFNDGALWLNLSVTDLRLWADDHVTPRWDLVRSVTSRLERGVPCLLSVGLTRPFASGDDATAVHWLQVNNIHLSDDPCWRLSDRPAVNNPAPQHSDDLEDLPF